MIDPGKMYANVTNKTNMINHTDLNTFATLKKKS